MNHSIAAVERTFGYTFNNKAILWEALQAPGSDGVSLIPDRNVSLSISREGNKRLAIVGDAEMTRLIARKWYATYELKSLFHLLLPNNDKLTSSPRLLRRGSTNSVQLEARAHFRYAWLERSLPNESVAGEARRAGWDED